MGWVGQLSPVRVIGRDGLLLIRAPSKAQFFGGLEDVITGTSRDGDASLRLPE